MANRVSDNIQNENVVTTCYEPSDGLTDELRELLEFLFVTNKKSLLLVLNIWPDEPGPERDAGGPEDVYPGHQAPHKGQQRLALRAGHHHQQQVLLL